MYLKRIEALGFKSFANKTVLDFEQGIMGIVGPNGSGKSNVADAVRWVLGEQSAKQLRGSNMQDVIFAGTENRKPLGYASVILTIDNRDHLLQVDYEEVEVARRVYRSGESEYLLNGHACRLRDIQELFYDTGVGKEGYSIIGQGQIDKILSNKPEDRRELFDEAAGIVKFKKRKLITQKKLETEEGNLVRVTDILNELEKQVGPLSRQSEKARQYLKWREELKSADMQAFRLESGEYRRRIGEAEKNSAIVGEDLAQVRAEAEKLKQRYDELSEQLSVLNEALQNLQSGISSKKIARESLIGRVRILEEQIQAAQASEQSIRERIEKLDRDAAERQKEYLRLKEEKQGLIRDLGAGETETASKEQELAGLQEEIRRLEEKAVSLQQKRMTAMDEKAELAASMWRLKTLREQAEEQLSRILSGTADGRQERQEVNRQIREGKTALDKLAEEEKSLRAEQAAATQQGSEAERRLRNLNEKLAQQQQRYSARRSQRDSLLNLAERYEGYGNSVRRVMEQKGRIPGIHGVVADLFQTGQEYETAIETALGGRIQNIVTDTEKTAKQLVSFLKENKYGRATFLPIESVKGRDGFPRPEALKETGAVGIASGLVEVEEEYRGIAAFLLGRYLVVDNIDHALAIAAKYRYSLNLVTLEGELLSPGGAITGGAYKNSSNLLGRRREIEALEEECSRLAVQITELREEAGRTETKAAQAQARKEEAGRKLHALELARNTASMDLAQHKSRDEELKASQDRRDADEKECRRNISAWSRELEGQEASLKTLEEHQAEWESTGEKTEKRLEELRAEVEQESSALTRLQQETASLAQKAEFLTETQTRVLREREDFLTELAALSESVEGGQHFAEDKQAQIEACQQEIRQIEEEVASMEKEAEEKNTQRESAQTGQQSIYGEREQLSERMSRLEKESYRLENSLERLNDQLGKLVDYIWTEYEMTPSEAEAAAGEETVSLSESRKTVSRLKQQIRELGPVNVNAIEEYKEVSERYEFLKAQHTDLVEAAESLKKIIRDLENGMRSRFRENFARIQEEFGKVFRDLFGGGKGRLELAEAEDLLEAGIIINAQPPGKKLQNMMQLSGGEKALTAIALLFAIQNLKPSPFCLLDEIEAALDEPNVDRYAEYLNRLKKQTQFIVLTHRRGTMERADRLYGITMQEKGISALVSVNLSDPALTE